MAVPFSTRRPQYPARLRELAGVGLEPHRLGRADELAARLSLRRGLADLPVAPGQRGERLEVMGILEESLLGQGDGLARAAQPPVQLHEHVLEDVLLLAASAAERVDPPDRRGHPLDGGGVVARG